MVLRRHLQLTALMVGLTVADLSAAEAESSVERARALFAEATELREQGNYAQAAVLLREALTLRETPGLWFHLGYCEEQLGHVMNAWSSYERADLLVHAGAQASDLKERLAEALTRAGGRVSFLIVEVEPKSTSGEVLIDARRTPAAPPSAIALLPGTHQVEVRDSSRETRRVQVQLTPGERRRVVVLLSPPTPTAVSPAPAEMQATERRHREWLWVEGGAVVAGLALGVVSTVARANAAGAERDALATIDARDARPFACQSAAPDLAQPCADLREAEARRSDWKLGQWVGFGMAGLGSAAFVATWFAFAPKTSSVGKVGLLLDPVSVGLGYRTSF